jgi:plasmid maintenance system antidote protein VapI
MYRRGRRIDLWAGMQLQYDLYVAEQQDRPKIERFALAA